MSPSSLLAEETLMLDSSESLNQITNVSELNDVFPRDWAYDTEQKNGVDIVKKVMELNNNNTPLLIGGCSLIPAYNSASINPNNLVAAVAWAGDINSKNIKKEQREKLQGLIDYWKTDITLEQEQIRRMSLGYDAVMVIAESISSKKENESLQEYLINRINPFEGMTGIISFNNGNGKLGSDRIKDVSAIIKPDCSSTPCQNWNGQWKTEYEK